MKKRCQRGKCCGASCIERADDCYEGLSALIRNALISVRENIQQSGASRKAPVAQGNQQQIDKLIKALDLGPSERIKVGRNFDDLRAMALERKKELWEEITAKRKIGGPKAKAQEKALMVDYNAIKDALQGTAGANGQGPSVRTKGSRIKAKSFDDTFVATRSFKGNQNDFDWEGSIKGSTFGGKGAFGTVLFTKDGVVKRGEIGVNEASIIKKVGELGLGPSLVYGELGRKKGNFGGSDVYIGRVAMSRVEGMPLGKYSSASDRVGGSTVADLYWKARADLHRAGIAHNDAHGGNFFVSGNGVGKFVDLGLAQDNPKAALSEAIGSVMHRGRLPAGATLNKNIKGDFQAQSQQFNANAGFSRLRERMPETLGKISDNLPKVENYLTKKMGMSPDQAAMVMASGIRNPEGFYSAGSWSKISDSDAKKMIDLLYEGI
jgi:hypothetical protein